MEDQDKDWEVHEHEEKSASWIWDKGLVLGRKILVTGFMISTTPVILPPLIVISALGLACSVPCGVLLASYACTEKLMSKLLPINEEEKYSGGDFDAENEGEDELEKRVVESDEKGNEEEKILNSEDIDAEICGVIIELEEGERSGDEEKPLEVTSVAVEVCVGDDENEINEEMVKETTELIEKLRDEGMVDEGAGKEMQSEENVKGDAEQDDNRSIKDAQSEDKNGDRILRVGGGTQDDKNGDRILRVGGTQDDKASDDVKQDLNDEEVEATGSNVDVKESADESGLEVYDDKNAASLADEGEGSKEETRTNTESADRSEVTVKRDSPNEVSYSDEETWKQLDAIHKIVGYTAARQVTCIEELKALYVFTGVEPPTSFKDPSDFVEVDDKLKFLMSVIGVK